MDHDGDDCIGDYHDDDDDDDGAHDVRPGHRAVLHPGVRRVPAAEPRHRVHEEGGGQVPLTHHLSPLVSRLSPLTHHLSPPPSPSG